MIVLTTNWKNLKIWNNIKLQYRYFWNCQLFSNILSLRLLKVLKVPSSGGKFLVHVSVDNFSKYIVTVTFPKVNACYAVSSIIQNWRSVWSKSACRWGTNYLNTRVTIFFTPFNKRPSPRLLLAPWENGRVEVQKNSWKPFETIFTRLSWKSVKSGFFLRLRS